MYCVRKRKGENLILIMRHFDNSWTAKKWSDFQSKKKLTQARGYQKLRNSSLLFCDWEELCIISVISQILTLFPSTKLFDRNFMNHVKEVQKANHDRDERHYSHINKKNLFLIWPRDPTRDFIILGAGKVFFILPKGANVSEWNCPKNVPDTLKINFRYSKNYSVFSWNFQYLIHFMMMHSKLKLIEGHESNYFQNSFCEQMNNVPESHSWGPNNIFAIFINFSLQQLVSILWFSY